MQGGGSTVCNIVILVIVLQFGIAIAHTPFNELFLHDSRDCPETAVSLLHQKRLGSGSEPTKEKIKLLK